MTRPKRQLKRKYQVFCEGITEANYIRGLAQTVDVSLKTVDMHGGGYRQFAEKVRAASEMNCLGIFIIVDGDRAVKDTNEKVLLQKLVAYCKQKNQRKHAVPYFLIVNTPDFEYVACTHDKNYKNGDAEQHILTKMRYRKLDEFKSDESIYRKLNEEKKGISVEQMCYTLKKRPQYISNTYEWLDKLRLQLKITKMNCQEDNLGNKGSNFYELVEISHHA